MKMPATGDLRLHDPLEAFPGQACQHAVVQDTPPVVPGDVPSWTPESKALAKELKRAGFVFTGPVTAYAMLQACGVVDDHLTGCFRRGAWAG